MKLSEIKQILTTQSIQLTKSLGQNFLHDANQLQRIADAAELSADDQALEIGPGLGPLTERLVERAGRVLAIEKDARLVDVIRARFANSKNVEILNADALDYLREHRKWRNWKMVSNLPYSVASPILVELAQAEVSPELIIATLQAEVATRIMAAAGSSDYGLLSLLVQLRYEPEKTFRIPRGCFFPEPDVDSACIRLKLRSQRLLSPGAERNFIKVVRQGFSQRRKMMYKLLKQHWPESRLTAAFNEAGLTPQVRAEVVKLEQFVCLTKALVGDLQE